MGINYKWSDTRFINPYNFVRLGVGVSRGITVKGNLTGKISCEIITKTPLAILDAEKMRSTNTTEHKETQFLTINNKPIIPGSEIRGMVRAVYEALTSSCLSVMNIDTLSKRYSEVNKPGFIRYNKVNNNWDLYGADSSSLTENADPNIVHFDWAKTPKGTHGHDFVIKSKIKTLDDTCVSNYIKLLDIYVNNNKKKGYERLISPLKKKYNAKQDVPLWYYKMNEITYYLSPAAIGRRVFSKKFDELVGGDISLNDKSYAKCQNSKMLCPTCSLFGMVGKEGALGSKIRFSDAIGVENKYYQNGTIQHLKELSSPKTSSVEFYTYRPDEKRNWGYDDQNLKLRGRKFYFHHKNYGIATKEQERSVSTKLMDIGSKFSFDIYFDEIDETSLKNLIWILTIGENKQESNYCHKIGYGKPLGLGSIKVLVNKIQAREYVENKYVIKDIDVSKYIDNRGLNDSSIKEFKIIADFTTTKNIVRYPYVIGGDNHIGENIYANHQWFKKNRGSFNNATINFTIPYIADQDLSLPAVTIGNGNEDTKDNKYYGVYPTKKEPIAKDETFTCKICGKNFTKTAQWRKEQNEKGYHTDPTKCDNCKKK